MHPSDFYGIEGLQPGRENIAGRISPGELLTDSLLSSKLPVGDLPRNTSNQDPDLTALPASSPTVQSLEERTPKVCCGNWSCKFNSRCEKKLNCRERKKQRRLNELLSQEQQW